MNTPLTILVAQQELGDALLLQRAFNTAKVSTPVHFARDGQEVLDYLEGKPPFQNPIIHPLPALLILDLNLPRVDGYQVLRWLRLNPGLHDMIVVVFGSSQDAKDVRRAYSLGANSYIVKPKEPQQLVKIVKQLQEYWLGINPSQEQPQQALTVVPD